LAKLDLSPLEGERREARRLRLRFKDVVRLQPRLCQDNPKRVRVEDLSLGLDAFAGTVRGLLDEVAEDLVVLWKNYAMAPDANQGCPCSKWVLDSSWTPATTFWRAGER
jgi:hypothetical protein